MMQSTRIISREESKMITRTRLLNAAVSLLRSKEHSAITMSDITTGAGVTQPAFYRHFPNKQQCLREALEGEIQAIRDALMHIRQKILSQPIGPDTLNEVLRHSFNVLAEAGEGFKLVARELRTPNLTSPLTPKGIRSDMIDELISDVVTIASAFQITYDTEYLRIVADGLAGISETLVTGYIDARYSDIDMVLDLVMKFLQASVPELIEKLGVSPAS